MAAGAPLGSTFTIVDADGPWEMGEMAPREFVGAGEQQDAWQPDTIIYEVTTSV